MTDLETTLRYVLAARDPANETGSITDAVFEVARALRQIARAIENHAGGDSPLHGETLGALEGLSEIAEAIREHKPG
jgi:hypothetical protein